MRRQAFPSLLTAAPLAVRRQACPPAPRACPIGPGILHSPPKPRCFYARKFLHKHSLPKTRCFSVRNSHTKSPQNPAASLGIFSSKHSPPKPRCFFCAKILRQAQSPKTPLLLCAKILIQAQFPQNPLCAKILIQTQSFQNPAASSVRKFLHRPPLTVSKLVLLPRTRCGNAQMHHAMFCQELNCLLKQNRKASRNTGLMAPRARQEVFKTKGHNASSILSVQDRWLPFPRTWHKIKVINCAN